MTVLVFSSASHFYILLVSAIVFPFYMLLFAVADFNWEDENFPSIVSTMMKKLFTGIFPVYQRQKVTRFFSSTAAKITAVFSVETPLTLPFFLLITPSVANFDHH